MRVRLLPEAFADVAQTEEHRASTPGRPVRSGSSACTGLWCNGEASRAPTSLVRVRILAGLLVLVSTIVAGRSGSVTSWRRVSLLRRQPRFDSATRSHTTTATTFRTHLLRAGAGRVSVRAPGA